MKTTKRTTTNKNYKQMKTKNKNKRLSITSLLNATKIRREEQIRKSLACYGLPKNAKRTTDYLILQTAVKINHRNIVELLIDAGCRINQTDDDNGLTPLALAISNENKEIATLLLEKGANFEAGNGTDLTVLHLATEQKSLKMLQLLLQYNVDVNSVRSNKTVFQMFFDSTFPYTQLDDEKDIEIFKLFLLKGTSIDIDHKWSVLHFVATTNHKDIIQNVLQVTNNINQCTNEGNTSLYHLLQVSSLDEEDITEIVQSFILKGARIDIANSQGNTVIHLAANKKYLKVLQILFQCQWDVNCCNCNGDTVLHIILENSSNYYADDLFYQVITSILDMESFKFVQNNQGKSQLHLAIENSHKQIVNYMLLKPGIDVNSSSLNDYTILHHYLKHLVDNNSKPDNLDVEVIQNLISMGAKSDIVNDEINKITPMHFALILKDKTILQLLLDNFNFQNFDVEQNKSILHYLCYNIDYASETQELEMADIAEFCIKKGASINFRNQRCKHTPLSVAVLHRQKHMIKTLLENGLEINDFDAKAILKNLMESGFIQTTYYPTFEPPRYMTNVINISENIARDIEILELLASKGMSLDMKSNDGLTIFHYAASKRYTEMLQKLLPFCKYPNICDPNENTVLHLILNSYVNTDNNEEEKLIEIVTTLLSKEASVLSANVKGETPLHLAAKNKHFEIATILLQHGANATALDTSDNSVLHFLSMVNIDSTTNVEADLMTLLVSHGCNINARNKEGKTPIILSAQSGCKIVTRILLQYGAQIDCTADENLSMPLHIAAGCNHLGIIEELVKYGVDLNLRRKDGTTALHLSASHKEPTVTRILLQNGADTEVKDENGKTALHFACWNNSFENINELLTYGADVNAEDKFHVIPLMLIPNCIYARTALYYHIIKLQAANMFVSKLTDKCLAEYVQAQPNSPAVSTACKFFNSALAEISKMKEIRIDEHFDLSDLLHMTPTDLHSLGNSHQQWLQEFLFSDEVDKNFPLYGKLLRVYHGKNIVRSELYTLAKHAFQNIVGWALEDLCYDQIFDYSSNQDLRYLDKAAKIGVCKRKSFEEKEDLSVVSPLKRYRSTSF